MAEVTALRNNALPFPTYGAAYGVVFPILDADGDFVTGASSLDSEISKNGDTFADCTNEATEIGSTGLYYLLLTATELIADVVVVQVKTGTAGAKTTPLVLYPKKLPTLASGTAQAGGSGTITLASGASAVDDAYNGCLIIATIDSLDEARIILDYNGSTKVAVVIPDWNTTPDSDDTYLIKLPDGVQVPQANVTHFGSAAGTFSGGRPEVNTTHAAGTAWGSGAITSGTFASGALDAVWSVATRTLTAFDSSFKTGYALSSAGVQAIWDALTSALTTVGSIGKLLVDNINATISSRLPTSSYTAPPSVGAIADQVWEEALTDHSGTAGSTAEALGAAGSAGDPWATALPGAYSSGQAGKIIGDNLNATIGSRATQTSVDDLPTNAELATALAAADDAVLAAIAALNNLSQANIRTAIGLASANLDTQLGDLPTNSELSTALAAADDAVLAAIAALNNLSSAQAQTAAAAALTAYDPPTHAELTSGLAAADDAVLAAIAALNNLSAAQVTAAVPTANANADALLKRDWTAVTGEASRSALNALRFLRNKWAIAGGVLSVKKEDDSTDAWTGAVTQTAGNPVSEIDPA